jgi:hypothetical protein
MRWRAAHAHVNGVDGVNIIYDCSTQHATSADTPWHYRMVAGNVMDPKCRSLTGLQLQE